MVALCFGNYHFFSLVSDAIIHHNFNTLFDVIQTLTSKPRSSITSLPALKLYRQASEQFIPGLEARLSQQPPTEISEIELVFEEIRQQIYPLYEANHFDDYDFFGLMHYLYVKLRNNEYPIILEHLKQPKFFKTFADDFHSRLWLAFPKGFINFENDLPKILLPDPISPNNSTYDPNKWRTMFSPESLAEAQRPHPGQTIKRRLRDSRG